MDIAEDISSDSSVLSLSDRNVVADQQNLFIGLFLCDLRRSGPERIASESNPR